MVVEGLSLGLGFSRWLRTLVEGLSLVAGGYASGVTGFCFEKKLKEPLPPANKDSRQRNSVIKKK